MASHIRNSVLRGSLKPGEKIVERELARQFGTSLTVVREAIIQLETEGLIVKRPNASTAVVKLSCQDVLDIFAVRGQLERYAVVEAARRISDQQCENLERLYAESVAAAESGDAIAYIQTDMNWHLAVWRVTENNFLETALHSVVTRLFGFSYIQLATLPGFNLLEDAHSHRDLLTAIVNHRTEEAENAFAASLETWMDYALALGDYERVPHRAMSWTSFEKAPGDGRKA